MKKIVSLLTALAVTLVFAHQIKAQDFEPLDKSPMDQAYFPLEKRNADKIVRITYSRPQLKGRTLAKLAPVQRVWRTGADQVPEITFYKDVNFGGTDIKAGTYSLLTIPGEKEWTVIISKQLNVWGAYFYKESEDVARVKAMVSESEKAVEAFSMVFGKDMTLYMGWDKLVVSVPIK
jgi:hypothetical protein